MNEVVEVNDLILNAWKYVSGLQYVVSMIQNHPCYDPSVGIRGIMQQPLYDVDGHADSTIMPFSRIDGASTAAFLDEYLAVRGVLSQLSTLFPTERKRESVKASLRIPYEMLRTGKDRLPDLLRIPGFVRSSVGFCELEKREVAFVRLLEGAMMSGCVDVASHFQTIYETEEVPERAINILVSLRERVMPIWQPELDKYFAANSIPNQFMPTACVILLLKWNMDEIQNLGRIMVDGEALCPPGKLLN